MDEDVWKQLMGSATRGWGIEPPIKTIRRRAEYPRRRRSRSGKHRRRHLASASSWRTIQVIVEAQTSIARGSSDHLCSRSLALTSALKRWLSTRSSAYFSRVTCRIRRFFDILGAKGWSTTTCAIKMKLINTICAFFRVTYQCFTVSVRPVQPEASFRHEPGARTRDRRISCSDNHFTASAFVDLGRAQMPQISPPNVCGSIQRNYHKFDTLANEAAVASQLPRLSTKTSSTSLK